MRKHLIGTLLLALATLVTAQQTMNNDAIIKMAKAGLSDTVITATINASPGTYDTSANGLIALKQAGVSDKVISAIVLKASGATPAVSATAPSSSPGLPSGIDEVGVYYKNKSGTWTELMPEIVNFKTGGVLKSLVTDGIVKGDINGHVPGEHAQLSGTLPFVIAVYLPEGTEITEYQLIRFRTHSNSREFRSVTGGVFHASGGAKRDDLEFKPVKLAPRIFEITLDQSLGKGEYGLLPPGSYASSNMASGGKIYTVSIVE